MILMAIQRFLCRIAGFSCSPERPSSKDLKREMKDRGRRVEAETVGIHHELHQRRRDFMERVLTNTEVN